MDSCFAGAPCVATAAAADGHTLSSPNGVLQLRASLVRGNPVYDVTWRGRPLLAESRLGPAVAGDAGGAWRELAARAGGSTSEWRPVWGKRAKVVDSYRELTWSLADDGGPLKRMDIVFRAYDDGVAFRCVLGPGDARPQALKVTDEAATFAFAVEGTAWSYNRENRPRGPESLSACAGRRMCPVTLRISDDCTVALLEAAIEGVGWMDLESRKGEKIFRARVSASQVKTPFAMPWRVIMVGEKPGVLVDSDLLMNLNPPCAIADPSWIRPGVAFWDWRSWGHKAGGFTYGLDLPSWKRFVDLAAESGVPYLLLDANWYGPEFDKSSDPVKGDKARNVREIIRYGKERRVGILLYLNDLAARHFKLEQILQTYQDWGAAGIKYGFMRAAGQGKVEKTRRIIRLCAEHKLLCDFHDGPVPPSGDTRTWPNCVTREYCHSQSDAKRVFTPEAFCLQVYVNMLTGPLDMCNGLFDMTHSLKDRPKIFKQLNSTIVAETARTLITYSGLTVLPDSADMYRKHRDLYDFIAAQKQPWEQSRTLAGEIGDSIVMMRRTGDTILVAAATDENARTLGIPLDFLGEGTFQATLYEDAPDAHWQTNREAYNVRRQDVTAKDVIEARLAPGGGHCMLIRSAVPQP